METVDLRKRDEAFSILKEHHPFKEVNVFFDMENHLLNPHTELPTDIKPYGVLESFDGTVFAVADMNCGYGGHGPHQTLRLLEWLGIERAYADAWIYKAGIHIEFDENGKWIPGSLKLSNFFGTRERDEPQVLLGDQIFVDQRMRTIFFVDPQNGNLRYLFNALQKCDAVEFTYYYGDRAQLHMPYDTIFDYQFIHSAPSKELLRGGFIRVHGRQYDVICFAKRQAIYSLIQNLHSYFFGEGLFYEEQIFGLVVLSKMPYHNTIKHKFIQIVKSIFESKIEEGYASKPIASCRKPRTYAEADR